MADSDKDGKKKASKEAAEPSKKRKRVEEPEAKETAPEAKAKPTKEAAPKAEKTAKPTKEKSKISGPRGKLYVGTRFAPWINNVGGWKIVDASGIPVGRLSSYIAMLLMGKTKANYTPHADTGDHVIVINAKNAVFTGKKLETKVYEYHTNFAGGLKTQKASELMESNPAKVFEYAVWRMLPKAKGHMTRRWFKKLKVYPGPEHPHAAQKPETVKLPNLGVHTGA